MQPDETAFSLLYVTCPDKAVAETLAAGIVEEKLAACANVISGMTAIYPWQGKIANENEVILLLKTRKGLVTKTMALVQERHPYDVPAVLEIPLGEVAAPYKAWLLQETAQQPS